jgi:DNA-directed RNA polymerase specialized sigma24 family protein
VNDDDSDSEEKRGGRGRREEIFKAIPPPRKDQTPELQAIPEQELREACETLRAITIKILRSKRRALELYWGVWHKLLTTRRYDPTKGPLVPWMILVAKSVYSNAVEKVTRTAEHDAEAHEGFHREVAPVITASPEEEMLERAEAARAEAEAAEDFHALRARAAMHPIALRVVDLQMEGHKPKAIAEIVGVDVTKVYQASDSIRDYLKEIQNARREARAKRDGDEKP